MATEINPFGDVQKLIEQFKMPGVDMTAIIEARRKDIEAVVEANKAACQSMMAMASKQTEMLTQAMRGMQEATQGAAGGIGDPEKQNQVVRQAFEKTLTDMKELADMARRSQTDALAHVTKRGTEHLEEIRKLIQPKR